MTKIHWLFRILETPLFRSGNLFGWLIGAGLCFPLMSGQAWAQPNAGEAGGNSAIVAAGFGYQNSYESTITVKVYDAASGEVLSEEVYDLNIKEDHSARSQSSEDRIFAGGVGLGETDLSNFVVRVYDAKTGEFQWTGQLNLAPYDESEVGHRISTVMPRRAAVTRISAAEIDGPHPLFVLRALDFSTGGVLWADEFFTDGKGAVLAKQIAVRPAGFGGMPLETGVFDFRILMFDRNGRTILWEDQVFQRQTEEDGQGVFDDRAQTLPTWTEPIEQEAVSEKL